MEKEWCEEVEGRISDKGSKLDLCFLLQLENGW